MNSRGNLACSKVCLVLSASLTCNWTQAHCDRLQADPTASHVLAPDLCLACMQAHLQGDWEAADSFQHRFRGHSGGHCDHLQADPAASPGSHGLLEDSERAGSAPHRRRHQLCGCVRGPASVPLCPDGRPCRRQPAVSGSPTEFLSISSAHLPRDVTVSVAATAPFKF